MICGSLASSGGVVLIKEIKALIFFFLLSFWSVKVYYSFGSGEKVVCNIT